MAYHELIKHFGKIRTYMHEFYICGFKSRDDLYHNSKRSYDNERRRLESYLKDYMSFEYQSSKVIFLSIDSRRISHNPLYAAFQSKSFTAKDITLHFMIFDILYTPSIELSLQDILNQIDIYLEDFQHPLIFDESTLRKKLNEYTQLGLIQKNKSGKQNVYHRAFSIDLIDYKQALSFYSEIGILGVIGYYLLNRIPHQHIFRFKHHYIADAIDSEIIYQLFDAMQQHRDILIQSQNPHSKLQHTFHVIPLRIYISSQTGRTHLLAYSFHFKTIKSYRIDFMTDIILQDIQPTFQEHRQKLQQIEKHIWSIQCYPRKKLEHVEFVIFIQKYESYIYQRLLREKRCGDIIQIDDCHYRFVADVYDTLEMIPWIRTFICRITELHFSNRTIENEFKNDLLKMYQMYNIEGVDE